MQSANFAYKTRTALALVLMLVLGWLFILVVRDPTWYVQALRFNPYALASGTALVIDVALLLFFLSKPARSEEYLWLAVYLFCAAGYAFGEMMQRLSATPAGALFWGNFVTVATLIPIATFLFALTYTNQSQKRYPGIAAFALLAQLVFMFIMNFTNVIYVNSPKLASMQPWGWDFTGTAVAGPGAGAAVVWYLIPITLAVCRLVSFRRHTHNPILRQQSMVYILTFCIAIITSVIFNLVVPILLGIAIVPMGVFIGSFTSLLLVYGAYRYQLLEINPTLFATTMLNIMREAVIATDEHFNVVYQNPTAVQLLAGDASGSHKVNFLRKLDPEYVPVVRKAFDTSADVVNLEHIDVALSERQALPARLTSSRLGVGAHKFWIIVLTDITAELQTRSVIEHEVTVRTRELNEARTYLVSSINSLSQGFVLVGHKGQVVLLNTVARKLFKVGSRDTEGADAATIFGGMTFSADISKSVQSVLAGKHTRHLSGETPDGSFYEIYVTPVLSSREHLLGATVVIQDVTEAKILDRSKDEFFSIASHELRTPLTAIRGNMSMAKDYFADQLKDPALKDLVEDTHAASVRLIEIVNDFLDSSRLEQGKMAFTYGPVKIAPLVEAVRDDLKVIREQQGNTATTQVLDKLPPVWADEGRLRQILYNLLSNANKYSEKATVTVTGLVEGDQVKIRVSDTGKGISPENQKLLFHKFQQAGSSILTRDNTKGTGLGLYISKLLAKAMHGDVVLEHSEAGKGTTFAVLIPVATKQQLSAPAQPAGSAAAVAKVS